MKKILISVMALVLVFAMAACGGTTTPATAAPTEEPAGIYTPGTYTATATGMGTVTVNVTVDANAITAVELDVSNETAGIGQAADVSLIEQIMAAQSAEIAGVSGATITSTAVKTALADCLAQAAA